MQKRGLPELATVGMESGTSVNYLGINLMTVTLAFSLPASRIIRLGPFNVDSIMKRWDAFISPCTFFDLLTRVKFHFVNSSFIILYLFKLLS